MYELNENFRIDYTIQSFYNVSKTRYKEIQITEKLSKTLSSLGKKKHGTHLFDKNTKILNFIFIIKHSFYNINVYNYSTQFINILFVYKL